MLLLTLLGGAMTTAAVGWVLVRADRGRQSGQRALDRYHSGESPESVGLRNVTTGELQYPEAHSAVRAAKERWREFRGPGALAVAGVWVSTAASVWSLYLN